MPIIPHKSFFHLARLVLYLLALLIIYSLDLTYLMSESICYWYTNFDVLCPMCGGTRSFLNFVHLNFSQAFHYNAALTIGLYPLASILVVQDAFAIISNVIFKTHRRSLLLFFADLFNLREVQ